MTEQERRAREVVAGYRRTLAGDDDVPVDWPGWAARLETALSDLLSVLDTQARLDELERRSQGSQ